jgi:tRNA (guanine-N7-)-methyltransferase
MGLAAGRSPFGDRNMGPKNERPPGANPPDETPDGEKSAAASRAQADTAMPEPSPCDGPLDADRSAHLAHPSGLHGRRRGKKLRGRHADLLRQSLPQISLDASKPILDARSLFNDRFSALWLEIGFGGGEHLAAEASRRPEWGYIGCEAFLNGVAKALALIEAHRLRNVRLYEGDARDVIEALPPAALDGVYLLYPDPWPKRRQRKRRFLSDEMLTRLARIMRPGAELRFATDIDDNAGWTLARILRSPDFTWRPRGAQDWRDPWDGWGGTRYEAKALLEARRPAYFTFRRNDPTPDRGCGDKAAAAPRALLKSRKA